jgi:hypothetical protein
VIVFCHVTTRYTRILIASSIEPLVEAKSAERGKGVCPRPLVTFSLFFYFFISFFFGALLGNRANVEKLDRFVCAVWRAAIFMQKMYALPCKNIKTPLVRIKQHSRILVLNQMGGRVCAPCVRRVCVCVCVCVCAAAVNAITRFLLARGGGDGRVDIVGSADAVGA